MADWQPVSARLRAVKLWGVAGMSRVVAVVVAVAQQLLVVRRRRHFGLDPVLVATE